MFFWTVYKVVFMPAIKNHSMMDLLKIHKKRKCQYLLVQFIFSSTGKLCILLHIISRKEKWFL